MPTTKNLGLVRAIHVGTSAPANTKMLWYNTNPGEFRHYYYDTNSSTWELLIGSGAGSGTVIEKTAVRVASTGQESAVTYDNGSGTITVNAAEGPVTIDGVELDAADDVLWGGDGGSDVENGIYTVTTKGDGTTPWVLTRRSDSDSNGELANGEVIPVTEGVRNQGIAFMLVTTGSSITLGSTQLKYHPFSIFYSRGSITTITVGGLQQGSTVEGPIQHTLDKILFPYQQPSFDSFEIQGQDIELEVGEEVNGGAGAATFNWSTINDSNIKSNIIEIIDVTNGNNVLGTGLANDGTENLAIVSIVKSNAGQTHQFKITGEDTESSSFEETFDLTWLTRRCFFINATDFITPSGNDSAISTALNALTVNTQYELSATRQMQKELSPTNHYIYFAWLDSLGGDENIFTVNGNQNTSWVYKTFTYTNSFGNVKSFRLFRSQNILSTNFDVIVN